MIYERLAKDLSAQIISRFDVNVNDRNRLVSFIEERLIEGYSIDQIKKVLKFKCAVNDGKEKPLDVMVALSRSYFNELLDESYIHESMEEQKSLRRVPIEFGGSYEDYINEQNNY